MLTFAGVKRPAVIKMSAPVGWDVYIIVDVIGCMIIYCYIYVD